MKYLLVFVAGLLCPFVVGSALYWLWWLRGKNTGWPA